MACIARWTDGNQNAALVSFLADVSDHVALDSAMIDCRSDLRAIFDTIEARRSH